MIGRRAIQVHYGQSPPAIGNRLLEQLSESSPRLRPGFLFLVPARSRQHQLARLLLERQGQFFDEPILTLSGLVRRFLEQRSHSLELMNEREKLALLARLIEPRPEEWAQFSRLGTRLNRARRFITFFRGRNIRDSDMLRLHYRKHSCQLSAREEERLEVFQRYQRFLAEHALEDREGALGRLYEALITGEFTPGQTGEDGFTLVLESPAPATPLERGVLRLLLQAAPVAHVVVAGRDRESALKAGGDGILLDELESTWTFHDDPSEPARLSVLQARGRRQEVELAAERMTTWAQAPDLAGGSRALAVIASDPAEYRSLVDEIFEARGLSVAPVSGRACAESCMVQAFNQYLEILEFGFPRDLLFDFLSAPSVQPADLTGFELTILETWARRLRIRGGMSNWLAGLGGDVKSSQRRKPVNERVGTPPEAENNLADLQRRFACLLQKLHIDLRQPRPVSKWFQEVAVRVNGMLHVPREAPAHHARRDNSLFQAYLREIWRALDLWPEHPVPFAFFRHWCLKMSRQVRRTTEPDAMVGYGSPAEFESVELEKVVWLGMTEDEFPRVKTLRSEELLPGESRPTLEQYLTDSSRAFQRITESTRDRLVFTCPRFVRDSPVEASAWVRQLSAAPARFKVYAPPAQDGAVAARVERGCRVQRARETELMSVWQGRIRDPGLLKTARSQIFSAGVTVTPSQLESYLQCGYRYFVSNLLRMEPLVAPQEELNSLELGLLLHRVLSRFFGNGYQPPGDLAMAEGPHWTEQQLSRMSRFLRVELERVRPEGTGIGGVFLGFQLNALERGLDGSLPRGLLAEFVAQLWKRRRSSEVEAVELAMPPVPLGAIANREGDRLIPVHVAGTVDRLDRRAHCLVVVDYKTGMDQHLRLHQGWGFQLPLYLLLTASARPGKRVRGAFYLIQLPQRLEWREIELRGEESDGGLGKLVRYYREKALQATRSIYQGEFPITLLPPRQAGCANCAFRLACHYQPEQAEALRRSGRLPTPETVVKRGHWVGPEEAGS